LTIGGGAHNRSRCRTNGAPQIEHGADVEGMMPGQTSDDLLALFDSAPLNRRYWVTFILMSAVFVFDFLISSSLDTC
jgi:hypothetical protein